MLRLNEFWQTLVNMFSCESETIHLKKCVITTALKFIDVLKLSKGKKKEVEFQSTCKQLIISLPLIFTELSQMDDRSIGVITNVS